MKIAPGKKIEMEYELRIEGGAVIESSTDRGPIQYVHGSGSMLPGLERQLEGLGPGDEKEGVISAEEAYGSEESLPTATISRDSFPTDEDIVVGKSYEANDPEGKPVQFSVVSLEQDKVAIRFSHPLAGKRIRFSVKILQVRNP